MDSPMAANPRRSRWLIAAGLVLAFVVGYSQRGHTFEQAIKVYAPAIAVAGIVAAGISYRRASQSEAEARGWHLAAAANLCAAFVPQVLVIAAYKPELSSLDFPVVTILAVLSFVVLFPWAFCSWPWRRKTLGSHAVHCLGALSFVGSLLLILFELGAWHPSNPGLLGEAQLVGYLRLSFSGGTTLYLISEDPRRIRGAMGWYLAALVPAPFVLGMLYVLLAAGDTRVVPLLSLPVVTMTLVACAPWSRLPVEPAEGPQDFKLQRWWEALMNAPLVIAGLTLIIREPVVVRAEMVFFVVLAMLSVARQFLLMNELGTARADLARANGDLKELVRLRTNSLEAMQAAAIRTGRANTVAVLGAGVVHDLNNSFSTLEASLELVASADSRSPEVQRYLDIARDSTRRAASLVSRLMSLARGQEQSPRVLDLAVELSQIHGFLTMVIPRRISFRIELCDGPVLVQASRSGIEQMLVNLVSNACDAIPQNGEIVLRLRRRSHNSVPQAIIEVKDTGKGIPPELANRIFEPFFTTKEEGKGTGLGLPSVRAAVEEVGGSVWVDSEPGVGTTFTLCFPVLASDHPLRGREPEHPGGSPNSR